MTNDSAFQPSTRLGSDNRLSLSCPQRCNSPWSFGRATADSDSALVTATSLSLANTKRSLLRAPVSFVQAQAGRSGACAAHSWRPATSMADGRKSQYSARSRSDRQRAAPEPAQELPPRRVRRRLLCQLTDFFKHGSPPLRNRMKGSLRFRSSRLPLVLAPLCRGSASGPRRSGHSPGTVGCRRFHLTRSAVAISNE